MRDNCVIFTNSYRQQLRVVFDPDGTAFFCGPDLAVIAGYEAPQKAVTGGNKGVNRIDSVLRRVPWDNGVLPWPVRLYLLFCRERSQIPVQAASAV